MSLPFTFLFPALAAAGIALVSLPIIIHLINLLRHRRIKWAAMEFLLQSQKKHKKWIILKQLLLLLMRMAAVAVIVFMLAQLSTKDDWGFGGTKTHHVVLLDDSFSMTDRWGESTATLPAHQPFRLRFHLVGGIRLYAFSTEAP